MGVRVVLLEKIASLTHGCFETPMELPDGTLGPWVALGHFDAMFTYKLDTTQYGMFKTISKDSIRIASLNSANTYFHPLYLISDQDDHEFWKSCTWYFSIARIHFAQSVDVAMMRNWLNTQLEQDELGKACEYRTYRTIELSDTILALKSNNMKDMLTFILSLRKYSCIGKVYTYCGVDYSCIKDFDKAPPFKIDDNIPLFSMRFSVSNLQEVDAVFAGIEDALGEEDEYSIVGVDDIAVSWNNLSTSKLVDLYHRWFITTDPQKMLIHPEAAFSDVTTRVGIPLKKRPEILNYDQWNNSNEKLRDSCKELITLNSEVQNLAREYIKANQYETLHRWLKSLSELTKALMRMSRTAVMDEFVYLMLPGARSFLRNVKNQLSVKHVLRESDIRNYHKFIEYWTHLMEHIMRLEGQLTHQPEIRPIIYDMPITMLEYTLAFLVQCANVLQTEDNPKAEIDFLLVPQLCERIVASELFPATKEMPGLVLVSIPLHMLYDPMMVQSALCHETSHFVGETYRNRKNRLHHFTASIAVLMAKTVFQSYDPGLIITIRAELRALLKEHPADSIKKLVSYVMDWAENLLHDDKNKYSEFIRKVLHCKQKLVSNPGDIDFDTVQRPLSINSNMNGLYNRLVADFKPLLFDLMTLFRETYADLCMAFLLAIDPVTYVRSILVDFFLSEGDNRYEQFAIRVYACLQASNLEIPKQSLVGESPELNEFYCAIEQLKDAINSENEDRNRLIPIGSVIHLLNYLTECHESLVTSLHGSDNLEELRAMFSQVTTKNLKYDKLEQSINMYRKRIIGL